MGPQIDSSTHCFCLEKALVGPKYCHPFFHAVVTEVRGERSF